MARAAAAGAEMIWVDALNPRPRVWPAVAKVLRAEFPDLLPRYRRILFDAAARAKYLGGLQTRVRRAAERGRRRSRPGVYVSGQRSVASG